MKCTILIAGATGLVGKAVTEQVGTDDRIERAITWGRRPVPGAEAKVEHWGPVNGDLVAGLRNERVDAVICCLGTTMKNVNGDKAAFTHVDHDLVIALGKWAAPGSRFCLVSSLGADAQSLFFYNRVKGEVERSLKGMDLPALHIFRPSMLDGPRKETRIGERIGLFIMKALRPLLPKPSRPMPHDVLAQALVNAATSEETGTHTYTYEAIHQLAKSN